MILFSIIVTGVVWLLLLIDLAIDKWMIDKLNHRLDELEAEIMKGQEVTTDDSTVP